MAITLTEPIVNEVVSRLTDDLPDVLTALNAEVTDGFTLATPLQVLDYPPTPEILTEFPTLAVSDGVSKFEDDIGSYATGRHLILITAHDQDADQQALVRRLRRWSVAIVRTVLEGRALDSAAWGTGLEGVYPGPPYTDTEDPESIAAWSSWVGVRIWAKSDEE